MASFYGVTLHILQIFSGYKKKIQLLRVLGIRDSCRELFKTLNILPHQSQYIFLLHFAVMNMDQYKVNSDIHGKDTTQNSHLYQTTSVTLSKRYLLHGYLRFSKVSLLIQKICFIILNSLNWF